MMQKNVGGLDRTSRIIMGAALIVLGALGYAGAVRVAFGPLPQALFSIVLALLGLVVLATGLTQRCMINSILGRNTAEE